MRPLGIICALLATVSLVVALFVHRQTKAVAVPSTPAPVTRVSGKDWLYEVNFPIHNPAVLERLIQCESKGLNVSRTDSSGQMYSGVLQFNSATWKEMEQRFDFHGDPRNPSEAIHMADMMISGGLIGRWTCARSLD
jgi:Transglycosylase-like domain